MRAAATDWTASDVAILAASVAGLAVVSLLLLLERGPVAGASARVLGSISERSGSVRRRPPDTLVWDEARLGELVGDGESIFVGPDGAAAVALDGGGQLEIDANSLVVLEAPGRGGEPATVRLRRGGLSATAAGAAVRIRGARGDAALRPGAQARVTARDRLEVELLSGRASVGGESALLDAFPIRLTAPARDERQYFSGAPATVALRWDGSAAGGYTLEVAREPGFGAPIAAVPGGRGEHAWAPPSEGIYYWRLVDGRRVPGSETRKLVVVEDVPPLPFAPAEGEVVVAPPGRTVPFRWTEVDGVPAYLLEISSSPAFDSVALSAEASGPGIWVDPRLPEGSYFWRVRSVAPGRGRSPDSRPSSFRIVHTGVPEAPELLTPTLEVDRAGR